MWTNWGKFSRVCVLRTGSWTRSITRPWWGAGTEAGRLSLPRHRRVQRMDGSRLGHRKQMGIPGRSGAQKHKGTQTQRGSEQTTPVRGESWCWKIKTEFRMWAVRPGEVMDPEEGLSLIRRTSNNCGSATGYTLNYKLFLPPFKKGTVWEPAIH